MSDLQVFGFTSEEKERAERFVRQNPEAEIYTPLIDNNITKSKCLDIILKAGIDIPMMYKLGYNNNNCIGCVKGGAGYWNKIRKDFPEVFERMAKLERKLNNKILKVKGQRIFLDELPKNAGRYKKELSFECGVLCGTIEEDKDNEK
jgi:argininosuccinate synthase